MNKKMVDSIVKNTRSITNQAALKTLFYCVVCSKRIIIWFFYSTCNKLFSKKYRPEVVLYAY